MDFYLLTFKLFQQAGTEFHIKWIINMPEIAELIFHSELESMRTRLGANGPGQLHRHQDVSVRAYLVAILSALAAPHYLLKLKIPLCYPHYLRLNC